MGRRRQVATSAMAGAGPHHAQELLNQAADQLVCTGGSYLNNDHEARTAFATVLRRFASSIAEGTMSTPAREALVQIAGKILQETPA